MLPPSADGGVETTISRVRKRIAAAQKPPFAGICGYLCLGPADAVGILQRFWGRGTVLSRGVAVTPSRIKPLMQLHFWRPPPRHTVTGRYVASARSSRHYFKKRGHCSQGDGDDKRIIVAPRYQTWPVSFRQRRQQSSHGPNPPRAKEQAGEQTHYQHAE